MPAPVTYRGMTLLVPDNDSEWVEYYAHARQHKLVMRACNACGHDWEQHDKPSPDSESKTTSEDHRR